MNIAFRVDGNSIIGMGHIVRCLSLAKEFQISGCRVFFISVDPVGIEIIKGQGFEVEKIESNADFGVNQIAEVLKAKSIDCLVIDSYQVSQEYFLKLKTWPGLLCYIDDINLFVYSVDILINGNIGAEIIAYQRHSQQELLLLGIGFNLIRDEFRGLPKRVVSRQIEHILITMGGSDPYHLTEKIIRELKSSPEFDQMQLNVVIGSGFTQQTELYQLSEGLSGITFHQKVTRMSELMLQADLAISAGGSTLYELCACGVPTLAVTVASNQECIVQRLTELGYIKSLGWFESIRFDVLPKLIGDYSFQERVAAVSRMQQLVDGYGVVRVKDSILTYFIETFSKIR
jgi:UDP-2,4-diacetamido-2,4,6-trideoxy-beta-L-altropyranose hydrolase